MIDGSEPVKEMARQISAALQKYHVVIMDGIDFAATDILPADVCILGCKDAHPAGFSEVERVLRGINLAGRSCGLFTLSSKSAIEYLRSIVRDSELSVAGEALYTAELPKEDPKKQLQVWLDSIFLRRAHTNGYAI
ncbi:MAG: hypothetical protein SNJ56_01310 [Termitinemataceae bacterium]